MRAWSLAVTALLAVAGCGAPAGVPTPPTSPVPSSPAAVVPAPVVPAPPPQPSGATVVLDPGHNGGNSAASAEINRPVPDGRGGAKACNTTGSVTALGYPEHAFNWDIALRVRQALAERGVRVIMTRSDDGGVGPCVDERAAIGNESQADAVVSIHADGAAETAAGFHVAHSDPPLADVQGAPSLDLAAALRDAMVAGGFSPADYVGERGLDGRADLAGLNLARRPAALVECANMRNPDEAALVESPEGRARYAAAIAAGVLGWLAAR